MLLTGEARLRKCSEYQERLYAISARLNNTSPLIPNACAKLKRQIELLPRARHPLVAWGLRGIFEAVGRFKVE